MNYIRTVLNNTIVQWFCPGSDPKIEKKINLDNLKSFASASIVVAIGEICFLIFVLIFSLPGINHGPFIIVACATSCVVVSIALRLLYKFDERTGRLKYVQIATIVVALYFFMSFMSAGVDIAHYKNGDQMLFFYIVQFCFLLFMSFRPFCGLTMITLSFGWFLGNLIAVGGADKLNITSLFIFYVLAVFGNAKKFSTKVHRYREQFALELKERENEIVISQSGKYISRFDLKKNILYNSVEATKELAVDLEIKDPLQRVANYDFILPESKLDAHKFFYDMTHGVPEGSTDFKLRTKSGEIVWQHGDYTLQKDDNGEYVASIISFSNVTEQINQKLLYNQRLREVVALSHDCDYYIECNVDGWYIDDVYVVEDSMRERLSLKGKRINDAIRNTWKPLIYIDDFARFKEFFNQAHIQLLNAKGISSDKIELRLLVDGKLKWYCIEICLVKSIKTKALSCFVLFRNIDEAYQEHEKLISSATQDKLTGLYNRENTMRLIEEYLATDQGKGTHALIMLDLDNLKKINDTLGHQVGDEALRNLGNVLSAECEEDDICGRIGGDEFFVFYKNTNVTKIVHKAKKILADMEISYGTADEQIFTSVSMGIAMYHGIINKGKTLKELYAEADAALYKSKVLGKNTYTFSDETDALADSSTTFLKNDLMTYNLKGLLDNLANGIAIFHGSLKDAMHPVFCNAQLPKLLDITPEDFFNHMSAKNGYAIHPEDLPRARSISSRIKETNTSDRDIFRLRTGSGAYRYVTVISNIHKLDDDSMDLYCIFSDAEEREYLQKMQENRRIELQKKKLQASESNVAYTLLNISQNTCKEIYYTHMPNSDSESTKSAEDVINDIANDISLDEYRNEFLEKFTLDIYRKDAEKGISSKEIKVPFAREGRSANWYQLDSEILIDSETGELEAFITFTDIDNEKRLEYVIDRMLENEYEYLSQIDVQSGCLLRLGESAEDGISDEDNGKVKYDDLLPRGVEILLPKEYRERGLKALCLDKIISELKRKDRYLAVFPVLQRNGKGEKLCQWSFEYIDDNQDVILLSRKNISQILEHGYDPLTGLLGRQGFYNRCREKITENPKADYAMIEVDLDNFSLMNEERGYTESNRFLRQFAVDLRKHVKAYSRECIIGHFEGDSFAFLLSRENGKSPEELYNAINFQAVTYQDAEKLRLRMGIYDIKNPLMDIELMCDHAHIALRACKGSFDKYINYFTARLKDRMLDEQILASEMQKAIDEEQFEIWFQPQINNSNGGTIVGAEALVRWSHPTRGMLPPAIFIPLFEQNGFIYELDKYVWRKTCAYIRKWIDDGMPKIPISINVSRVDILKADFIDTITNIIEEYKVPHELINIEITESAFSENSTKVIESVKELINRGFSVAIDDFGSGYSSLSMVKSVPAQMIKLDMRFFADQEDSVRNECIIESIVRMSKMLGMAVLAEGVETKEQAELLNILGCDYIQGYLFSRPLPYDAYIEFVQKTQNGTIESHELKSKEELETDKTHTHELFRNIIAGTNDIIIVADVNTKELLYANRAAEKYYAKGFDPLKKMTCTDFCEQKELCMVCPVQNLKPGEKKEMMVSNKDTNMKGLYSRIEWNGHDAFVFYQTDISAITSHEQAEKEKAEKQSILNAQVMINEGLQEAFRLSTAEETIEYILEYVGKAMRSDRAYIFEKNEDDSDSNTFEWVAEGVLPQIDNLQNIPSEVPAPWYESFKHQDCVIIEDVGELLPEYPEIYEMLKPKGIDSLIVAPFFGNDGEPIGFFGLDNPDREVMKTQVHLVQTVAFFIEAMLKRRNLERQVKENEEKIGIFSRNNN